MVAFEKPPMPCRLAPAMCFSSANAMRDAMTSSLPSRTSRCSPRAAGLNVLLFIGANCASSRRHGEARPETFRLEGPSHRHAVAAAVDDKPPPHEVEVRPEG